MDQKTLDQIKPFSGFDNATSPSLIANGMALQQVKTQYTTAIAVQKPRDIYRVADAVLQESAFAGADFYYRWTIKSKQGDKVVEGPSIGLAMCMVRNYGNCALDVKVNETPTHYLFTGVLIDLETGFTCSRLFRQRKSQALGRYDQDRSEDIAFQIGQSKALRNTIVHAMPSWLTDQAMQKAYAAELNSINGDNIADARLKCIEFFGAYGVTVKALESKIGKKLDKWKEKDIVELRANATALKEGRVSIMELFPTSDKSPQEGEEKK